MQSNGQHICTFQQAHISFHLKSRCFADQTEPHTKHMKKFNALKMSKNEPSSFYADVSNDLGHFS